MWAIITTDVSAVAGYNAVSHGIQKDHPVIELMRERKAAGSQPGKRTERLRSPWSLKAAVCEALFRLVMTAAN